MLSAKDARAIAGTPSIDIIMEDVLFYIGERALRGSYWTSLTRCYGYIRTHGGPLQEQVHKRLEERGYEIHHVPYDWGSDSEDARIPHVRISWNK